MKVLISFLVLLGTAFAGNPVLLFSDLTWGPKTGWEGSATKGAAITIWGKNFGATRGSNYVTVNGTQLTTGADYAEWDAIGPARGLERITFWLNSSMADGAGTIAVNVGGATSNTLPFTIAPGTIYFISASGSNGNNGLFSTHGSGVNGPFHDLYMFNPRQNSALGDTQFIMYVRSGTYTIIDPTGDDAFVSLRGPYGSPTAQKALVGYPGDTYPYIDDTNATRGVVWTASYAPYGFDSYFTFAKLDMEATGAGHGYGGLQLTGVYNRAIGNKFQGFNARSWRGIIMVAAAQNTYIFGNYFNNNGNDSYEHDIYVKAQLQFGASMDDVIHTDIGWNEIANGVSSDLHGGSVYLSWDLTSAPNNVNDYAYIHDNYFHDGYMDWVYVEMGLHTYIYNNIFGRTLSNCCAIELQGVTSGNTDEVYLYNNVFNQAGENSPYGTIAANYYIHAHFSNNIFFQPPGKSAMLLDNAKGGTIDSDHDLFWDPSTGLSTVPPAMPGITVHSPIIGNPLFVNQPASADLHLQAGSPAIGKGTAAVSSLVTHDYDGGSRPSPPSIGAFEPAGATAVPNRPTKPNPPTKPTVVVH